MHHRAKKNRAGIEFHSHLNTKKLFTISLFCKILQGRDLQERHTEEHCGGEEYFGTTILFKI
jgi:hypothetical protein